MSRRRAQRMLQPSPPLSVAWWALLVLLLALLPSCGGGGGVPAPPPGGGGAGPSITTGQLSLPEGWTRESYSATLQASGGSPPYTWSVLPAPPSGPVKWLHAGLTLGSSGMISGIPTESGTYLPTFEVRDSAGRTARKDIFITIHLSVGLDPTPLDDSIVGRSYAGRVRVWGGQPPYTMSVTAASDPLPAGLILTIDNDPTWAEFRISGTPLGVGNSRLEFTIRDGRSATWTQAYPLRIVNPLATTPAALPSAGVGYPYSVALSASGGVPPYTWTLNTFAQSPPGLNFDPSTATLSGSATVAGTYSGFLRLQDSGSPPQSLPMGSLRVVDQFTITKLSTAFGVVDKNFNDSFEAAGGQPPFFWSVRSPLSSFDIMPPGTTLNADGTIAGVPTTTGQFYPVIEVRDSSTPQKMATGSAVLYIIPRMAFASTTLPDGVHSYLYRGTVGFPGGTAPYRVRLTGGSLPPGTNLNPALVLAGVYPSTEVMGTVTALGQFPFTLEVTDSSDPPDTISAPFSIRINSELLFQLPAQLPSALEGTPYSYDLSGAASGGVPPYSWQAISIPYGLALNASTGVLSGTPYPASWYYGGLYIRVSDSSSPPQQKERWTSTLAVIERLRATSVLPSIRVGAPLLMKLGASGGVAPYRWTLLSGSLPAGLAFDAATATISGTPTIAENRSFTVRVEDSGSEFPQFVQQILTLNTVSTASRNDSIATATPLSNGTYQLSISPMDDSTGSLNPDVDYFAITASPAALVGIVITAELLSPPSPLDSVVELVDTNGQRLFGCDFSPNAVSFNWHCMNDDDYGRSTVDSAIYYRVPGIPGTAPVTFYVKVLDWSGDARPDFRYEIAISGAN